MIEKLKQKEERSQGKRLFSERLRVELNYSFIDLTEETVPKKGDIQRALKYSANKLADGKFADFIFCSRISFNVGDNMSTKDMVAAIAQAGPSYKPPCLPQGCRGPPSRRTI